MMHDAPPQKEHQWLQKLVGEWTYEAEADMGPGKAPERAKGVETVRSIGGLWIVAEGQGEMPGGGPATSIMTLGYDPRTKKFTGTWIGSMMTQLWVYEGSLDPSEKVLTLAAEGPSMTDESKTATYHDVIHVESDDHRILKAHVRGSDGKWQHFMTSHYRRTR
jgi:hypothetical protein